MEYIFTILLQICTLNGCSKQFTDNIKYKTEEICIEKALEKSIEISEELINYKSFDGIMYKIIYTCKKRFKPSI